LILLYPLGVSIRFARVLPEGFTNDCTSSSFLLVFATIEELLAVLLCEAELAMLSCSAPVKEGLACDEALETAVPLHP